jgi:hypothetical protein
MTPIRVFVVALLFCSLPSFAQNYLAKSMDTDHDLGDWLRTSGHQAVGSPSEPWRLIPGVAEPDASPSVVEGPLLTSKSSTRRDTTVREGTALDPDTMCYTIRSYVVARDTKDSDSTHPVRYSTCQPAGRYRLKTTEMRSNSADR